MNALPTLSQSALALGAATLAAVLSLFLTDAIRAQAVARSVIDHPGERSSHSEPTPRGGGLAIVVTTLAFILLASVSGWLSPKVGIALGGGGILVAGIGLLDDVRQLRPGIRLAVHFLAAAWTTAWLGGLSALDIGTGSVELGAPGFVLATVGLVWATNLFNFMDGSDGLAAAEALVIAAIGGTLLWLQSGFALATVCFVLAGSCVGFLRWNWAPARIFMGDVGSGFLGFLFGALAIAAENGAGPPLLVWAMLAAVFIVDATVTFIRRLRRGFWREAHRSHGYQRLIQYGWSHRRVALAVFALNLVLSAMAVAATFMRQLLLPLAVLSFLLIGLAYVRLEKLKPFAESS